MDQDIQKYISALVEKEQQLRDSTPEEPDKAAARAAELRRLEEQLDQCWDLLRQRRAKRKAGEDPGEAETRPVDEVEHYRQ
ncbi:DUF2630 family protein [Arthrobacter sulfonylureivorans]|uniref:DUF2630 family protein n=1 Tax=Arthrobacter sulfonylureivorans TaxID=2486855 RepID=UPI0039E4CFA4